MQSFQLCQEPDALHSYRVKGWEKASIHEYRVQSPGMDQMAINAIQGWAALADDSER